VARKKKAEKPLQFRPGTIKALTELVAMLYLQESREAAKHQAAQHNALLQEIAQLKTRLDDLTSLFFHLENVVDTIGGAYERPSLWERCKARLTALARW